MGMGAPKKRSGPGSMRRRGLMPDPDFRGSWIPDKARRDRLVAVAAAVVRVLKAQPGIGVRKMRAAVRKVLGHCADADTDAAVFLLGLAVQRSIGARGAHRYVV